MRATADTLDSFEFGALSSMGRFRAAAIQVPARRGPTRTIQYTR